MTPIMYVAVATLLIAGCIRAPATVTQSAPQPQLVATLHDLMEDIVQPAAYTLWDSTAVTTDKTGIHQENPKTQEDWDRLRRAAILLAESPNLIVLEGRDVIPLGEKMEEGGTLDVTGIKARIRERKASFAAHAIGLQLVARQAIAAIDTHDLNALNRVGGDIDAACESCHQEFWYPPAGPEKK